MMPHFICVKCGATHYSSAAIQHLKSAKCEECGGNLKEQDE